MKQGGAAVSDKHANFIVNSGTATLADVRDLIAQMGRAVLEECGVALEREVLIWGRR